MRNFGNNIKNWYGSVSINQVGDGNPLNLLGAAGLSALGEFAGNGNVIGTSSLAVGQTAAGVSTILARGAQALNIGVNGGGQIALSSAGALTVTDTTGSLWGAPTGGAQGSGTINAAGLFVNGVAVSTGSGATTGSFTATFVGGTTSPTSTAHYTKIGTQVVCSIPAPGLVTSNSTGTSITGIPVAIQPTSVWQTAVIGGFLDNGVSCVASGVINGGTISLTKSGVTGTLWTASGNKSMSNTIFVWDLN
jgi:hypothetical protein